MFLVGQAETCRQRRQDAIAAEKPGRRGAELLLDSEQLVLGELG